MAYHLCLTLLALLASLCTASAAHATLQAAGGVEVRIDPRVELLSTVFRLAGSPEYNMPNAASPYAKAVEAHFGSFRDHAVVARARKLRQERGISFDAVMSLAVHLQMDSEMIPSLRTALDPRPPQLEGRWTAEDAAGFADLLASFARDTDFQGFMQQQREFHRRAAEALGRVVNRRPIVHWFDRFFGTRPQARYIVIAGLLNGGGNYGVSYRTADGAGEEITPIIGIYRWDDQGLPAIGDESLDTIVHEFCHPYANAAIDGSAGKLDAAGKRLLAANRAVMQRQAYGTGRTVLYESLVRACVVRYMDDQFGGAAADRQATAEARRGFAWVPDLARLLAEYENDRERYKTFDDFMPRVVEFFDRAAADAHQVPPAPKVVSISPAHRSADVDPTANELVITFDRPMRDGSWSIVQQQGHPIPKFGKPVYDAQRRVLRVPMPLEPGKAYRFWLNAGQFTGFASADGTLLEPVEVTFTTRGG